MDIANTYKLKEWDEYYGKERKIHIQPKKGFFASYDLHLCNVILQKFLPSPKKNIKRLTICEIGSGDGKLIKDIADKFGYKPYGIEYSTVGAQMANKNGVETIVADAFDPKIKKKYKNYFDIVLSYGFIEHILPPEKAIQLHLDLVKKGGYIVIQLPRFKGYNYWKARIFRPDLLPLHNLGIMDEERIHTLMKKFKIRELVCKNYGTLKLRLPMEKKNIRYYLLKGICILEYVFNPLFRIIFGDKGFETKLFSPAILFIGQKE